MLPAYPNSFNAQTTIPFTLDRAGKVGVTVYDILGREMRVQQAAPLQGWYSAGMHEVVWNAEGVSSGVYLVRLTVGGRVSIAESRHHTIGQAGKVELKLYDVLGREMRVQQAAPLQGWYSAGMHEVVWNAEGVSSGVYLVRLTVGGRVSIAESRHHTIGQAGKVGVTVYDILGREMRVQQAAPLQGWYSAGMHEVVWNAEGVSSGVYLVRLTVDGRVSGAESRHHTIGQVGKVELKVYDVLGREMRVQQAAPLQGWYSAGMHEVVWNAEGVSSGVYLVRLVVEGGVSGAETRLHSTRKVVLVK